MAYSPGDLLVRGGALTAGQLRQAIDRRAREGGSLGESIVALGFRSEDELVALYQKRLVLPRITEAQLQRIDRDVLALVPPELAAEFRVVPVHMDPEEGLTIAMSDPADMHAIEEIGFFVDKFILRYVATESAVRRAIQRYYGLLGKPTEPDFDLQIDTTPEEPPHTAAPPVVVLTKKKDEAKRAPVARAPQAPPPVDEPVVLTKKRSIHPATLPGVSPGPILPPIHELRDAEERDLVAKILLDFAARVVARAALFVSRKGELIGFDVRGPGLDRGRLEMLQIPLSRPSLFEAVVKSRLPYRGAMPDSPQDKTLARALGAPGGDVLVWPILVRDRVVAVLYADTLSPDLPEAALQATLYEAGRAYERLLMQKSVAR